MSILEFQLPQITTSNDGSAELPVKEFQSDVWIELEPVGDISLEETLRSLDEKRFQLALKGVVDFFGAAAALVVLSPFLLFIALLVKLSSPGPVLFRQERWGKNLRKIQVYKFRTMYTDQCDRSGVAQTMENDPRVTRVGAALRRYNLDELPQLFNVLRGEMSLVGPRCHAIGMKAAGMLYEELVPEYHLRHLVRPGITGLAQVRGFRGPTVRSARARARVYSDLYYVNNYSLFLDAKIIVKTLVGSKGSFGF